MGEYFWRLGFWRFSGSHHLARNCKGGHGQLAGGCLFPSQYEEILSGTVKLRGVVVAEEEVEVEVEADHRAVAAE